VAERTFRIGRFGCSCLGKHAAGTLASVILISKPHQNAMPIKYCRRPPPKTSLYFFKEVRQKVAIYDVITIGFRPSSINQLLII
jgi:hypothetical protein